MKCKFLGNHFENAYPQDAPNLFKKVIFVVIKLGADVNDTVQQLFRPLSIQVAHYYSSKIQTQGVITNAFLEILFVSKDIFIAKIFSIRNIVHFCHFLGHYYHYSE